MKRLTAPFLVLLVLSVLVAGTTVAFAAINESAQADLVPASSTYLGASGTAAPKYVVDEIGAEFFAVEAHASGLLSNAAYQVWVGGIPVGSGTTDDLGEFVFASRAAVSFPTLLGLEVWIVEGTDMAGIIALAGRVTQLATP